MKTIFLFPGQGSQYVGMGQDLYDNYENVRELYDRAESLLNIPIKKISFTGPEEQLKQTKFTQPALFIHSIAVSERLKDLNLKPSAVAGHSLGEYSALVCAGALGFEDGLKLVKLRGELMQQSGENNPGTMAAIIGLNEDVVKNICGKAAEAGIVQPANFNSPGQIVISGSIPGVYKAMELARESKARMVTELIVSGAFHSPLMGDALSGLIEALEIADIRTPGIPVYSNVLGTATTDTQQIRELLQKQLLSPVLWQKTIKNMIQDGYDKFYEVGASKVLSGLNKRINREYPCTAIGKVEDFEIFQKES